MHPVLIDLGGFELHGYGAMGAVGFVVLSVLALRDARARGYSSEAVVDVIFWTALAAIAGSRLVFFLQNQSVLTSWVDILNPRTGGLVFYGAFLGLPVGIWLARRRGLPVADLADLFGRLLPLAHGCARIGCFLAGCCWGLPTDLPWGVVFTDPRAPGPHDLPLHPVQLYEAAGLFAISAGLTWLAPRKRFDGQVMLTYLLAYAVLRSLTEVVRGDAERGFVLEALLGPTISTSQAIAAAFVVLVAVAWPWLARRGRAAAPPATPAPPGDT